MDYGAFTDMEAGHIWAALVNDHGADRVEAWAQIAAFGKAHPDRPPLADLRDAETVATEIAGGR
jgi:hypothetical protein